ncbi:hypothetical protein GWI33_022145 [Rhynchophorus ferrugineus]|uniref:Uncharacterized protein n=1 Tax=Rhynchophorus ferrugineus TaxID=354439 RepID=A0A834INS1_RHYFE|nr:hypothetical protein GWI33_022145 [Rhynchophorus ferrugineus]
MVHRAIFNLLEELDTLGLWGTPMPLAEHCFVKTISVVAPNKHFKVKISCVLPEKPKEDEESPRKSGPPDGFFAEREGNYDIPRQAIANM